VKLDDIAALEDDWDGYGAVAVSAESIELARHALFLCNQAGLVGESLCPTPDGEVVISFRNGRRVVDVETLEDRSLDMIVMHPDYSCRIFSIETVNQLPDKTAEIKSFLSGDDSLFTNT